MQDLKSTRQNLCSELVSVRRLTGYRRETPAIQANLEEIGEWSALLLTEESIPNGTKIRIQAQTHELTGRVKSCTSDGLLGFFVDIELDQESRWSEQRFVPQHLFALCPTLRYFTESAPKEPEEILRERTLHLYKPYLASAAVQ